MHTRSILPRTLGATALLVAALIAGSTSPAARAADAQRTLRPDDVFELGDVGEPQLSPDGTLLVYAVTRSDRDKDEDVSQIWAVATAPGAVPRQLTRGDGAWHPRLSPDGGTLAYLAKKDKKTQIWIASREFGEPQAASAFPGGVSDFAWSPDGKRMVAVAADPDPDEIPDDAKGPKTEKPIVLHRRQFKRDGEGYLKDLYSHLYVLELASGKSFAVTGGARDDSQPQWSPDGTEIAFTSHRDGDQDADQNTDIFVVAASPGATSRAISASTRGDSAPQWSPDGKTLAWVQTGDPADLWYGPSRIAAAAPSGGPERILAGDLDRNVESARFTPDGRAITFLLEDGGNRHLAQVALDGGGVTRILAGERDVADYAEARSGALVVLESEPQRPNELFAVEAGQTLRPLSRTNDAFLAGLRLGPVRRFRAHAKNGPPIDVFLTLPPDAKPGARLPTLLRIHGGPTEQFSTAFELDWQMLAAQGYAVLGANPRGSSGYGRDFCRAIWADWGNKDYDDVMAAVDQAIADGVADPDRLGVFGWSYGGILTDYVITKTSRFKAAATGASEVDYFANYGTDHYQYEWETELGLPWRNTALWLKLSPFFQVDKVTTPTLILGGLSDWNVPALNSEQLFQALRRLGKPAELVLYPGQSHQFSTPSYRRDRYERYVAWFDRWIRGHS